MINEKLPKMWYGGDYNPEQWDADVWKEDDRMFKLAGIDVATINVFAWALSQPDEETYDFGWLDETIDRLYSNGVYVCLATSTGAHPAWMARKYRMCCVSIMKDGNANTAAAIIPVRTASPTVNTQRLWREAGEAL